MEAVIDEVAAIPLTRTQKPRKIREHYASGCGQLLALGTANGPKIDFKINFFIDRAMAVAYLHGNGPSTAESGSTSNPTGEDEILTVRTFHDFAK